MQTKTRGGVGEAYLGVGPAGLHYKKTNDLNLEQTQRIAHMM